MCNKIKCAIQYTVDLINTGLSKVWFNPTPLGRLWPERSALDCSAILTASFLQQQLKKLNYQALLINLVKQVKMPSHFLLFDESSFHPTNSCNQLKTKQNLHG